MFEQELIDFLAQLVSDGVYVNANLTGVNEVNFVGEAITQTLSINSVVEGRIYLFKKDGIIQYRNLTKNVDREKIIIDPPRRVASEGETLPIKEVVELENFDPQIRYDFTETTEESVRYFNFKYVDVLENTRDCIINTMIRSKYTQDQENALLRKRLLGEESLNFLKFNNWVTYSKGVADGIDLTTIKSGTVYEVTIPMDLCKLGQDYGGLAFETLIKNITFGVDYVNGTGKAYPTWIVESDLALLGMDPRVSVVQVNLFIGQ